MALTALQIYNYLPKTNCGKCGFPTCLAFAMQLANQKTSLDKCPDVSEEAKKTLEASAAPPMRLVKIGVGENELQIGDETELFRHEKTFYHPTLYCLIIDDSLSEEEIRSKASEAKSISFERVGQIMKLDLIGVRDATGDAGKFETAVKIVREEYPAPMMLMSKDPEVMKAGLKHVSAERPLIYAATAENVDAMASLAKENSCPLVVLEDKGLEELASLSEKVKNAGVEDIVLDFGAKPLRETLHNLTIIRRLALKKGVRSLGYPVLVVAEGDSLSQGVIAGIGTMKYAGIVAMTETESWKIFPLMTLRQNIFTDPQKPIQVKSGIYEINGPTEESPVLITTNFSLTYFTVSGDIETSKVPSWLLVTDSEGLSVMTAFAADKFNADTAADLIASSGIEEKVKHRDLIIPGLVARMSAKLKEKSGWDIHVGPRDSSGIPKFLKEYAGS